METDTRYTVYYDSQYLIQDSHRIVTVIVVVTLEIFHEDTYPDDAYNAQGVFQPSDASAA